MSKPAYSSLTAFLAHRDALRRLSSRSSEQADLLAWMDEMVGKLADPDRAALGQQATQADGQRRRERAERALLRLLRTEGAVSG